MYFLIAANVSSMDDEFTIGYWQLTFMLDDKGDDIGKYSTECEMSIFIFDGYV